VESDGSSLFKFRIFKIVDLDLVSRKIERDLDFSFWRFSLIYGSILLKDDNFDCFNNLGFIFILNLLRGESEIVFLKG
jgi:hypothetical protein